MTLIRNAFDAALSDLSAFAPDGSERVARLRGDLALGLPGVLEAAGGAGLLLMAAERAREDRLAAALRQPGAELLLSAERAAALGLGPGAGAGRAGVVIEMAGRTVDDLTGLADPMVAAAGRMPATAREADGLRQTALALSVRAELLPALLCLPVASARAVAWEQGLAWAGAAEVEAALVAAPVLRAVSAARVPMAVSQAGRVHVFRPDPSGQEHYAVEIGNPDPRQAVLVRVHSACFTGDVLGSRKCDCGPQLQAAMAAMAQAGGGVLIYLNQEGRGIGLANKMRAYALQDRGLDTVEANHHLGFRDDLRDFRLGSAILGAMGLRRVRLMTNNPAKLAMLGAEGIEVVERVPLRVGETPENAGYLATKARKSGHMLT